MSVMIIVASLGGVLGALITDVVMNRLESKKMDSTLAMRRVMGSDWAKK